MLGYSELLERTRSPSLYNPIEKHLASPYIPTEDQVIEATTELAEGLVGPVFEFSGLGDKINDVFSDLPFLGNYGGSLAEVVITGAVAYKLYKESYK